MRKILVAFATKNGSTEGVASAIAETLGDAGHVVDVRRARDMRERVAGASWCSARRSTQVDGIAMRTSFSSGTARTSRWSPWLCSAWDRGLATKKAGSVHAPSLIEPWQSGNG